ncbi:MAG: uncharacterized protein K0R17_856 [Rariglobus sp.]|nr:uncharacterized protein [Rariglobus sp.]
MLDLRSFRHPSRHRSAATRTSGRRLGLLIAGAACSPAVATDYTWNGLGSDNNWSSAANWLGGAAPANDTSTQLFFAGSTRLLPSADAPWSIGGLTFNSDAGAFTLGGSTLTLASGVSVTNNATTTQTIATSGIVLSEASTWNAASGGLTVSSVISGSGSLTKTGTGTLTLSGANTYSGNTLFNGGILSITNNSALGTGDLVFDGGTLSTTTGMVTTRNTTIDSGGANFALSNGFYTLNGNVTGTGGLTKTGTSILTLNGAHTYTGATVISGGTLKIADNGGTASTFASSSVNISSGARMIFNNSQTYAGAITGAGYIEREFSGTTTLTGAASHTGGTNVILGTLQIGNGGTSGSLDGNVALSAGGTLAFNRSDAASFGGVISGDGYVTKAGAGTLTLSGTNTYSRGTTISGGLVNFANLDNFGSGAITLNGGGLQWADGNTADVSSRLGAFGANGATFDTNGNNVTLASALSGGALTKTGDGTLTLAGGSSFGNTEITRGTLSIASADSLGSGLLIFDGGTLQTTATFTLNHGMPFAGTFDVVNDTTLTLENSIGGSSNLTKSGGGTLVLQSGNSYQGGTDLTGGTLSISSDSQLGDSSGQLRFSGGSLHTTADLTLNRSLLGDVAIEVDAGTTATVPTSFGDGGSGLVKSGAGALLLTGTNDFSTVSLNEGTLKLGSSGALGSSGLISFAFGTLQYSAANTVDYSSRFTSDGDQFINIDTNGQAITFATALGSGSRTDFAKLGAGSLTLSGKNTFSYLYVKDGSLTIQDGASISNYVTSIGSTAVSGPAAPPAVVNVSGPDASWEIEHTLSVGRVTTSSYYIGDSGGTLNISQGASVSANIVNLGSVGTIVPDGFAVTALINVTGAGSSLSVNNNLTMAVGGTDATLAISDGASVSMSSLWMGHSTFTGGSQGSATVTISGAGSSLTTQYLRAGGRSGPVSISVSDGAQLISGAADQSASIANADPFQPGASVVSISGAGSQWTVNAGGIAVGHSHSFGVNGAEGELTVADHGKVTVQGENNTIQLSSSRSTTSKGTLNIGAAASAPAASAGFVSAAAITGGLGTGIVQFNTTGTALAPTYFTADGTATGTATPITGRVSIVNTAGTTVLKGENSYTGGNTINGGTLVGDASSIKGDIANHSAVIFNQATDGSHTGVISGAGSFTKTGAGVLSVGGVNTYTGATTISGGTLLLTGIQTHLADSPPVAVLDATSGVVTNSGAVTSWADLSGSGNHATAGAGSVTLGTLGGGRAALVFDGCPPATRISSPARAPAASRLSTSTRRCPAASARATTPSIRAPRFSSARMPTATNTSTARFRCSSSTTRSSPRTRCSPSRPRPSWR